MKYEMSKSQLDAINQGKIMREAVSPILPIVKAVNQQAESVKGINLESLKVQKEMVKANKTAIDFLTKPL